jgi:hypothetical protein
MLQVLEPEPGTRKNSTEKSEAQSTPSGIQTAARRDFSEDFMKKVFLLIVVSALLTALGFAQTPTASSNPDQINVKGCLGGSDGHYTVAEDNTGQIFKITSSSADLKPHLGHSVKLIGHKAGGAVSSDAADSSLAVTELNMISEHCTAAAAAPAAIVSTPSETPSTPATAAAAPTTAPAATVNTPDQAVSTPAAAAPATTSGTPSEAPSTPAAAAAAPTTAPVATVNTPVEAVTTPAAAAPATTSGTPLETLSTPVAAAAAPTTALSTPAAAAVQTTRPSARAQKPSATPAAPAETVNTPAAAAPAAPADAPSETARTPVEAATKPATSAWGGSLWILVSLVVVVLLMSALVPLFNRWRKRKLLEQTSAQNLSFTNEASSDQGKSDEPVRRKAA